MFEEIYEFDNGVTNLVMQDWQILHNTELKLDQPKIYIHLDYEYFFYKTDRNSFQKSHVH